MSNEVLGYNRVLKITRYRPFSTYLYKIETFAMRKGFDSTKVGSLRWNRLQLCIYSIQYHILEQNKLFGVFC